MKSHKIFSISENASGKQKQKQKTENRNENANRKQKQKQKNRKQKQKQKTFTNIGQGPTVGNLRIYTDAEKENFSLK